MIRLSRLIVVLVVALAIATGCAGCGPAADDNTIHIAVCGPMTGGASAFGAMIKNAAKLKEKEINAAGGIMVNGKKMMVSFDIFDDKAEGGDATNVSRTVSSDNKILAVVGHFNSACSLAARDEYNRVGIPMMSPGSTNVKVCAGAEYAFRNLYRDDYQGDQIALYLKNALGLNKAAVLYDNDDYGKGLKDSFTERAKKIGLEFVEISYIRGKTQDFKPLAQQAKDSGAEAIFVAGLYPEAALIANAAHGDLKWNAPLIGGDGVMSDTFVENAGKNAEGSLVTTPFLFNTGHDSDMAKAFMAAYLAEYKVNPDTWAALTYDACGMILEAISKVGQDRKAIRDALAAATSAETGYTGVTGVTYFDKEGDCYSKPVYVAVVKDGKFVPAEKQIAGQ
ncbi:MAG: ABC transporter substrate-binding protein [Planctomycetota bacterium]